MIDDIQKDGEQPESKPLMTPEAQKKFLYAAGFVILMGASFFAGRMSVQPKTNFSDPTSQFKIPTPVPQGTPVPILESALTEINFSGVSASKKASVLADANAKKCACNCGMSEAECIVKDPNCPFWKDHVNAFQTALGNGKKADLSRGASRPMAFPQGGPNGLPQGLNGMGNQIQFPPQKTK